MTKGKETSFEEIDEQIEMVFFDVKQMVVNMAVDRNMGDKKSLMVLGLLEKARKLVFESVDFAEKISIETLI